MNTIAKQFTFEDSKMRAIERDGEPWFVAADVARILGYRDAHALTRRIDSADKGTQILSTPGGGQEMTVITEAGLYVGVLGSTVPRALTFKMWVVREVLPSIRKTGGYGDIDRRNVVDLISKADLARMILESEEEKAVLSAALESATPAIEYHDRYVANDDAVTVGTWAAQFGLTDPQARKLLVEKNVIYRFSIGQRFSTKKNAVVEEFEYRARAGRVSFAWFDLRPQHNAPRHHNGQVRQTLYVRQSYALDLGRKLSLVPVPVRGEMETGA